MWLGAEYVAACSSTTLLSCLTETDDKMRAFAEQVFASETKDENTRDEISMFDVAEDCPILHHEMAQHLHTDDNAEKRWYKVYPGSFWETRHTDAANILYSVTQWRGCTGLMRRAIWLVFKYFRNFSSERTKPAINHTAPSTARGAAAPWPCLWLLARPLLPL